MRLIIQPGYDEVSQWVAQYVVRRIQKFEPTADKPFVLGEFREWATYGGLAALRLGPLQCWLRCAA